MKGVKTGGRTKGTPNKFNLYKRHKVQERLQNMGWDVLAELRDAIDHVTEPVLRAKLLLELLPYQYVKPRPDSNDDIQLLSAGGADPHLYVATVDTAKLLEDASKKDEYDGAEDV